jgi:hypothetical protein
MSSTHKSKTAIRVPALSLGVFTWPEWMDLRQRLQEFQRHQLPADAQATPIRIGIEDAYGDLVYVVETTRLTEAVKVYEMLSDFGLVPGHGRCRTHDGRTLVRTYRRPDAQPSALLPLAEIAAERLSSPAASAISL